MNAAERNAVNYQQRLLSVANDALARWYYRRDRAVSELETLMVLGFLR